MSTEKLIPHDTDAEESVIGSLLLAEDSAGKVVEIGLKPEDFYLEKAQKIYAGCTALAERRVSINQITLAQELASQGTLQTAGGAAYLSHLIAKCPTPLDLRWYAEIVKRLSIYRQLINAGQQIIELGQSAQADMGKALGKADDMILNVRRGNIPSPIVTPEERTQQAIARYTKLHTIEAGVAIKSGLIDLDRFMGGGFYNGDMVIIAARPGVGKSTFAQTIANNVGFTSPVLFCSAEMNVDSLSDRDVASIVGKPISVIRLGGYDPDLYCDITGQALEYVRHQNVYYYQDIPMTTEKILQAGIAMKLRYGLTLVVVDYLGLLDDDYGRSQYERVSYISRKMKQVARMLDVPVLALHQLSRALEERVDKRPQLFDLRDTGKLEEDADVVLFLYRESYYADHEQGPVSGETEILVAKQRQGPGNGRVRVYYDDKHHRYRDLDIHSER